MHLRLNKDQKYILKDIFKYLKLHDTLALKLRTSKFIHFDDYEKAFVIKQELRIHLNYHIGKRPHPCRIDNCKKAFPDPNSRQSHERKVNPSKAQTS
jgi:hypothetical protein